MIFGFSKKQKCANCASEIPEGSSVTRSGEVFCSEEHADAYVKSNEDSTKEEPKKGGCCH